MMNNIEITGEFSPHPAGALIPAQAYLYFPPKTDQIVYIKGNLVRYFFYGRVEFEQMEKDKLKQFHQYIRQQSLTIPNRDYYNDQRIVQFLGGNKYDLKKTYQAILANRQWRNIHLPPPLCDKVKDILRRGYVYVSGRDKKFRPIVVLRQGLMQNGQIQLYLQAAIFAFQYIINNMFLPGQIENWIFIYDLTGLGFFGFPFDDAKKIVTMLSSNYGGKLYRLYTVNAPTVAWVIWKTVSSLIDPVTVQKTKMDNECDCLIPLLNECDKDQIEEKYGGTLPNKKVFWPIKISQSTVDESILISKTQYKQLFLEGKLDRNFVSPDVDQM